MLPDNVVFPVLCRCLLLLILAAGMVRSGSGSFACRAIAGDADANAVQCPINVQLWSWCSA